VVAYTVAYIMSLAKGSRDPAFEIPLKLADFDSTSAPIYPPTFVRRGLRNQESFVTNRDLDPKLTADRFDVSAEGVELKKLNVAVFNA